MITAETPRWMRDAACSDTDPELFYAHPGEPGEPERIRAAQRICQFCKVRTECLLWAFTEGDDWAILGGKTPRERHAILSGRTPRLRQLRDYITGLMRR